MKHFFHMQTSLTILCGIMQYLFEVLWALWAIFFLWKYHCWNPNLTNSWSARSLLGSDIHHICSATFSLTCCLTIMTIHHMKEFLVLILLIPFIMDLESFDWIMARYFLGTKVADDISFVNFVFRWYITCSMGRHHRHDPSYICG